jgi:hydroxymethylglutaryl-CoA lyase
VAVFGAASETFSKKNINSSIDESLKSMGEVIKEAKKHQILVRGYVSCVVGCPYEGHIKPKNVCKVVEKLLEQGCYEVSLGDTIGVGMKKDDVKFYLIQFDSNRFLKKGNPNTINELLNQLKAVVGGNMNLLAIHCHDTYGMALVNIIQGNYILTLQNIMRVSLHRRQIGVLENSFFSAILLPLKVFLS